jgi:hypothetical protein
MSYMKTIQNIKKTLSIVLCSTATTAVMASTADIWNDVLPYGESLSTVESVIHALNNGATVNAVVDLSKCAPQDGEAPSKIRGGLSISSYRIEEDGSLWFEDTLFTALTSPGRADPVRLLLRYLVSPGGAITVTSFVYSIPDYTLATKEEYDCSINKGVNFNTTYY